MGFKVRPLRMRTYAAFSLILVSACVTQHDHEVFAAKVDRESAFFRQELDKTKADLEATRQRLDAALRANADATLDSSTSKQKLSEVLGRLDEALHRVDEVKNDAARWRTELDARLDELRRSPSGATPSTVTAAPVAIPASRADHLRATEEAYGKSDWTTLRLLASEFVSRYAFDDRADDALFYLGDADMHENRPASALGMFNRILKQFPKSNMLDRTLFAMGLAYLALHDCPSARQAFEACEKRFGGDRIGQDARVRLQSIAKPQPGVCAPGT